MHCNHILREYKVYLKTSCFAVRFFTDVSVQTLGGTSGAEDLSLDKTSDITITNEGTVQFTVTANSDTFDEGVEVFEISMVNAQLVSGSGDVTTNNAIIYVYNFAPGKDQFTFQFNSIYFH